MNSCTVMLESRKDKLIGECKDCMERYLSVTNNEISANAVE